MIAYDIGGGQFLELADEVLAMFAKHRQARSNAREAGGQLFGRLHGPCLKVEAATGTRPRDRRARYLFCPDRQAERKEILRLHRRGLPYLGDWHTHPELEPEPSSMDLASIGETARMSRYTIGPLLLIIVGHAPPPRGLFVCLHDGSRNRALRPAEGPRPAGQ